MAPTLGYPIFCLVSFVLLTIIGFGPSLYLVTRQRRKRVSTALLIAPAVALAELGLILYPLFLNNIPVDRVEIPLTLVLCVFSAGLFLIDARRRSSDFSDLFSKATSRYAIGFLAIFFLLMLPAFLGGDTFRYWQGNSYDATNYWSLTYFAQHIPLREIHSPGALENAAQVNPALLMPMSGEPLRMVVELPLAWMSGLFNIPVFEFYYYFKLLSLAITFWVALAAAKRLRLPIVYRFSLAAALSIGFWPWFVSDIDALSHIYSIPLGLLFLFSWLQLEEDVPLTPFSRQRLLFCLSFAALLGYYPEFVPLTVFGIVLYYAKLVFDFPIRDNLRRIPGLLASVGMIVVLILPTAGKMIRDLIGQSTFAGLPVSNDWASGFFGWLYTRRMLTERLWGLFYFSAHNPVILLAFTALGIALGATVLIGILTDVLEKSTPTRIRIITSLLISFWGGALVIFMLQQDWIAGKAFTMGFPFAFAALFVFGHQIISNGTVRSGARYVVAASLAIWSVIQFLAPGIRALHIATEKDFVDYPPLHSPIGTVVPMINYLSQNPPDLLVSYFPETPRTIAIGWDMMLSGQFQYFTLNGLTRYYEQAPIEFWQHVDRAPSHLLFDSSDNFLHTLGIGTPVPVENTPFQLYAVTPEELDQSVFQSNLLKHDRENGFATAFLSLSTEQAEPFRTLEGGEGRIHFLAGSDTPIAILLSYRAASPSSISFRLNDQPLLDATSVEPNKTHYFAQCTTMRPGSNDLIINNANAGYPGASPLEIDHFQVMPADDLRVDVGDVNDGMDLSQGWYGRETFNGDENFRWAAQTAIFTLVSCKHLDYTLRFRAFPLASEKTQALTVSVNGTALNKIELENGLHEYEIQVPAALLNPSGLQSFVFQHAYAEIPPNDSRQLAVFYDWIEFQAKPLSTTH